MQVHRLEDMPLVRVGEVFKDELAKPASERLVVQDTLTDDATDCQFRVQKQAQIKRQAWGPWTNLSVRSPLLPATPCAYLL